MRGEGAAQVPDRPLAARRVGDTGVVEPTYLGEDRDPGDDRGGGPAELVGFPVDEGGAVVGEPERPHPPTRRPALRCALSFGSGDPFADALGFLAGDGAEDAGDHAAGGGGEVDVPGPDGGDVSAGGLDGVDEGFEVGGPAVEAVGVVGDYRGDAAGAEVVEEAFVLGAFVGPEGGDVVVDVLGEVGPPAGRSQLTAVGELAGYAFAVVSIEADPGVDGNG